jgi:hypothetical protein
MAIDTMLTTVDNPYDPFTEWDDWFAYDYRLGYHTPGLLARIAIVSDEMSDADLAMTIEAAIDEIVSENVFGVHKKVSRDTAIIEEENNLE